MMLLDLCNNPLTKEPKLDRARRQVPEWTAYDDEVEDLRISIHNVYHAILLQTFVLLCKPSNPSTKPSPEVQ